MVDSLTGGGGFQGGGSSASSGDATGMSGTGAKYISFGGNPNTVNGTLQNPLFLAAIVGVAWLLLKKS